MCIVSHRTGPGERSFSPVNSTPCHHGPSHKYLEASVCELAAFLTHSHTHTQSHTQSYSFSQSHPQSHSHTHSLTVTLSQSHSHTVSLPHSHTLTQSHSHTVTLTFTLTHSHTHSLFHTQSHSFTHTPLNHPRLPWEDSSCPLGASAWAAASLTGLDWHLPGVLQRSRLPCLPAGREQRPRALSSLSL